MTPLFNIIIYALLPVAAIVLGGITGIIKKPGGAFTSAVLHFAAGVVFSVVAVELLPDIIKQHKPIEVGIGFGLGIATMLLVKYIVGRIERETEIIPLNINPRMGLLIAMSIDLFIDGLLLGIGFAAGNKEGILLSIALALEVFSLGLVIGIAFKKSIITKTKSVLIIMILGIIFFVGAVLGITLFAGLSQEILELVLSFGLAALLFLVTEELLTEAHEEKERPWQTACFFGGFLLFLLIGMTT